MELILTKAATGRSYNLTKRTGTLTWSGDKAAIARKLEGESLWYQDGLDPELGDCMVLDHQGARLFEGWCVQRSARATGQTVRWSCYDRGMWLKNNDGTLRCDGEAPERFTRRVCELAGVDVAGVPATGAALRRKFAGVPLTSILTTTWSLTEEQTGKRYAVRMTPAGLLVKERTVSAASLVLQPRSNLMEANTTESIVNMCNSVAIYDKEGSRLTTVQDETARKLYGLMERHLTQQANADVSARAKR